MEETANTPNGDKKQKIQDIIDSSARIVIIPSKVAGTDSFCAGVGLYHLLKEKNKDVTFIYPGNTPENCEGLIESTEVAEDIPERELLITIDHSLYPDAKLSYSYGDDKLLVIKLAPIDKNFNNDNIKATLKIVDFDLYIIIGAQTLLDLGQLNSDLNLEQLKTKIINIDNVDTNHRFGNINLINSTEDSLSLLVLNNAYKFGGKVGTKSARALLKGITYRNEMI